MCVFIGLLLLLLLLLPTAAVLFLLLIEDFNLVVFWEEAFSSPLIFSIECQFRDWSNFWVIAVLMKQNEHKYNNSVNNYRCAYIILYIWNEIFFVYFASLCVLVYMFVFNRNASIRNGKILRKNLIKIFWLLQKQKVEKKFKFLKLCSLIVQQLWKFRVSICALSSQ